MLRTSSPFRAALLAAALLAAPALAHESTAPDALMTNHPRVSLIIGSHIYDDRNESIAKIEDVVLGRDARGPLAILQVPGIPELEARRVAVPLRDLRWNAERRRITLRGTTQRHLLNEPAFSYPGAPAPT